MTDDETLRVAALVAALKVAATALEKAAQNLANAGEALGDKGPTLEEADAFSDAHDARTALADYAAESAFFSALEARKALSADAA